jgi:hypothetical protein
MRLELKEKIDRLERNIDDLQKALDKDISELTSAKKEYNEMYMSDFEAELLKKPDVNLKYKYKIKRTENQIYSQYELYQYAADQNEVTIDELKDIPLNDIIQMYTAGERDDPGYYIDLPRKYDVSLKVDYTLVD